MICSCGNPESHIIARRKTADEKSVLLWSDGSLTWALGHAVRGSAQPRTEKQRNAALRAGRLVLGDVCLYDADEVPVGEDQKQHVELARDIAQRFNSLYGETFKLCQPVIPKIAARVMGLDDPTVKMSKSATAQGHAIRLTDEDKQILKAFKRAVTDSGRETSPSRSPRWNWALAALTSAFAVRSPSNPATAAKVA